jgi:hypothetical protein
VNRLGIGFEKPPLTDRSVPVDVKSTMSPQNKTIWVNLGALCALLFAAFILYAAMKGAAGARHWTSQLQTGSLSERSRAANALESMGPAATSAVPALLAILSDAGQPWRRLLRPCIEGNRSTIGLRIRERSDRPRRAG